MNVNFTGQILIRKCENNEKVYVRYTFFCHLQRLA